MHSKLKYYAATIWQIMQLYCWLLVIAALYVAKAIKGTFTGTRAAAKWCINTYSGFNNPQIA